MTYTSLEQLPLALSAEDVAQVLGISRANAYTLMHSKGLPDDPDWQAHGCAKE